MKLMSSVSSVPVIRAAAFVGPRGKFLFLLGLLVLFLRVPTFTGEAIQSDEAYHSLRANAVLSGDALYRDIVDRKPPLVPAIYTSIFYLMGKSNLLAVHIFAFLWVLASVFLLYRLTSKHLGEAGGRAASLIYLLFSHCYLARDTHAANIELFMNLPLILSAMFLLGKSGTSLLLGGVFAGAAFLFKQQGGMQLPVACLFVLVSHKGVSRIARGLALVGAGFLLPLAATALVFYQKGTLRDLLFWVFYANVYYVSEEAPTAYVLVRGIGTTLILMASGSIMWFFGLKGLWTALKHFFSASPIARLAAIWFVLTIVPVCAGWRFFPHYYLQLFPPLSVLAGLAVERFLALNPPRRSVLAFNALFILAPLVFWVLAFNPRAIPSEPDYRPIGNYVIGHTKPTDRIFVWGNFAEMYWYTKRNSATRLYNAGFVTGNQGGRPIEACKGMENASSIILEDFSRHPPELIIDTAPANIRDQKNFPMKNYPQIHAFVKDHYEVEAIVNHAPIYRLRDL